MGTILGKGFPQAQVHTVHSTSAEGIRRKTFFTMATLLMPLLENELLLSMKIENALVSS